MTGGRQKWSSIRVKGGMWWYRTSRDWRSGTSPNLFDLWLVGDPPRYRSFRYPYSWQPNTSGVGRVDIRWIEVRVSVRFYGRNNTINLITRRLKNLILRNWRDESCWSYSFESLLLSWSPPGSSEKTGVRLLIQVSNGWVRPHPPTVDPDVGRIHSRRSNRRGPSHKTGGLVDLPKVLYLHCDSNVISSARLWGLLLASCYCSKTVDVRISGPSLHPFMDPKRRSTEQSRDPILPSESPTKVKGWSRPDLRRPPRGRDEFARSRKLPRFAIGGPRHSHRDSRGDGERRTPRGTRDRDTERVGVQVEEGREGNRRESTVSRTTGECRLQRGLGGHHTKQRETTWVPTGATTDVERE